MKDTVALTFKPDYYAQHKMRPGWRTGERRSAHERSYPTSGQVSTGMGDLLSGIPSPYVTSQLGQLILAPLLGRLTEYRLCCEQRRECHLGRVAGNTVIPWHVSSRRGVATWRIAVRALVTSLYYCYRCRPSPRAWSICHESVCWQGRLDIAIYRVN